MTRRTGGRSNLAATIGLLVMLVATGCATSGTAVAASPVPTSTVERPRVVDKSDRPWVTFDPCRDIPNAVIEEAGYRSADKDMGDYAAPDYTFLTCSLVEHRHLAPPERSRYRASVLAGNVTLEEGLRKNPESTPLTVGGREALVKTINQGACSVSVRAEFGIVIFNRIWAGLDGSRGTPEVWCDGFVDTIELFLPYVP